MLSLLIALVILAVVVMVVIWLLRYMGAPDILEKVVVVLAVLIALVYLVGWLRGDGYVIRL